MKCKVEGCTNLEDLNFGEFHYHLRDVHAFGDQKMLEYYLKHFQSLRAELTEVNAEVRAPRTETLILKIVFLPEEATREGLIHVLSEVSGAVLEMEVITRELMRSFCYPAEEMGDDCGEYSTFCPKCPYDNPTRSFKNE